MWRKQDLGYLATGIPAKLRWLRVLWRCPSITDGGYSEVSITVEKPGQMTESVRSKLDRLIDGEVVSLFQDTRLLGG
jgi:hypothetical protein